MILRSLKVEGWRCYAGSVMLPALSESLNVIHAPNGSGKSTLFEAMTRAIFDSHKVTGEAIESIRPWGRQLSPTVTVEFAHENTEYQLRKRFLDDREARLSRKEDGNWVRLSEGDAVTERLREMFQSTPPGRGASDQRHWGIGQILWAAQGALRVSDPSESALDTIKRSLGVQTAGNQMDVVEAKIAQIHDSVFTAGGGFRKGQRAPEVVRLREQLSQQQEARASLLRKLTDFEEASRKVEDLRAGREQASRNEEELRTNLRRVTALAREYDRAVAQKQTCQANERSAAQEHKTLKDRIESIDRLRGERSKVEGQLAELREQMATLKQEAGAAETALRKAQAAVAAAKQNEQTVALARKTADDAEEYVKAQQMVEAHEKLIAAISEADKELQSLKSSLAKINAPDKRTLTAVRKAITARSELQTQLDASLIHLEIEPETAAHLEVQMGEPGGAIELESGKPVTVAGAPEVIAELDGVGRLRAYGPTEDADELRKKLTKAQAKVEQLMRPFGVTTIEELESLAEQADQQQNKVDQAEARLDGIRGDHDLDQLQQELVQARHRLQAVLNTHKDWAQEPPAVDDLKQQAIGAEREHRDTLSAAEHRRDLAQKAKDSAAARVGQQSERIAAEKARLQGFVQQLEALEGDQLSDDARRKKLTELALRWDAEKAKLTAAEEELKKYPQDPNEERESLDRQLKSVEGQVRKTIEAEQTAIGRLQQLADEGTYSRLAETDGQIEALSEAIERQELRLNAIRLLHELINKRHSEISQSISKPVAEKAGRLLQRIAGPRIGSIALDEQFGAVGVMPPTIEQPVTINNLSGGEVEQVHLVVRLALADQLAKDGRQLVVLDDVLTATDTSRLARIQGIMSELSQHLQIVVLTCHPERYRGLADAQFIDLAGCVES